MGKTKTLTCNSTKRKLHHWWFLGISLQIYKWSTSSLTTSLRNLVLSVLLFLTHAVEPISTIPLMRKLLEVAGELLSVEKELVNINELIHAYKTIFITNHLGREKLGKCWKKCVSDSFRCWASHFITQLLFIE